MLGLSGRESVRFPWDQALLGDLDVTFSFSSKASSWERAIELTVGNRLGGESLVTHQISPRGMAGSVRCRRLGRRCQGRF